MTYAPKPGMGALFKNDRKTKDIQPDYKGARQPGQLYRGFGPKASSKQ